jgi:hypothetical protein
VSLRLSLLSLALVAGCHLVFPHAPTLPDGDARRAEARAADARAAETRPDASPCVPPTCWDVRASLTAADVPRVAGSLHIFGQKVVIAQQVPALLREGESDATYSESIESCPMAPGGTHLRPDGWGIERTSLGGGSFKIRARGCSAADCSTFKQPRSAGEIEVKLARGWKPKLERCVVSADDADYETIPTYCSLDAMTGKLTWQAGEVCGGCCACADGAVVDIELTVER